MLELYIPNMIPNTVICEFARTKNKDKDHLASTVSKISSKVQRTLIFLAYPSLTTTIMRTFVCIPVRKDGRPARWLGNDLSMECLNDQWRFPDAEYKFIFIYAWAMVVVIVIGMPVLFWRRLSEWRYPFNRLYVMQENGEEGPAKKAKFVLGKLVVFNTANWFFPCLDMGFKLLLAGAMGVWFQNSQMIGACGCWLICGAIAAFFARRRPYAYLLGNVLSIISYVSLMGSYAKAIADKLHADGQIQQR